MFPEKSPAGSHASDITFGSLQSAPSSSSSRRTRLDVPDITWGTLATPNISQQSSSSWQVAPRPVSNSHTSSEQLGDFHTTSHHSTLPHQVLSGSLQWPLQSPGASGSNRKRPSLPTATPPVKKAKTAAEVASSPEVFLQTPNPPSPLATRFTSQSSLAPLQPQTPQRSISGSLIGQASSLRSRRQAKPVIGSPVWRHLQRLNSSRQSSRVNSPLSASQPDMGATPAPHSPAHINTSPLVPNSPLSTSGSLVEVLAPTHVQTPAQLEAQVSPPQVMPSNKDIHLSQLQVLMKSIAVDRIAVDELFSMPPHALFKRVYAACLMHAFYRPVDPNRTLVLLLPSGKDQPSWKPGHPAPTHILGLLYSQVYRANILLWGTCQLIGDRLLQICYTFYDSAAAILSPENLKEIQPTLEDLIMISIPSLYTLADIEFVPPCWSDHDLGMRKPQLCTVFCQLISTVINEFPCNFRALERSHPVRPLWAPDMVDAKVRVLLEQMKGGNLSFESVASSKSIVPPCVHLHGDSYEWDAPGILDSPPDPEAEDKEIEQDEQNEQMHDTVGEPAGVAKGLMVRPNMLESSLACLQLTKEADWYVTTSAGIRYQIAAPTDHSEPNTPASCCDSSSNHSLENSQRATLDGSVVQSFQMRFFQHRAHQHPSRVAYWKQLKESSPGDECTGLVTTHLWMSALLKLPKPQTLYIDPLLFDQLLERYKEDPLGMNADQVPLLFNRHLLWPQMGPTMHIIALAHVSEVCNSGGLTWLLLDLSIRDGSLKSVEVIIPPCNTFDNDAFGDLISFFVGALNRVLPAPQFAGVSSRVQQRTMTLVLPERPTDESILLVLLACALAKILDQAVPIVDVKAMRQSLCYYYDQVLRCSKVDYCFPWPGLTDSEGSLMTENNSEQVGRRRFMLASNREPSPLEMFPRQRSYSTTLATPGPSEPFFLELAQSPSSHPEGILLNTTGRSVPDLEKALLLGSYASFNQRFPDSKLQVPGALSLQQHLQVVQDLGGPNSQAAHRFLLLAKHIQERIKLDWLKDAVYPTPEQMYAGFDLDSLTLTSHEAPDILKPGAYYPYPDQKFGITTRNELCIDLDGKQIHMHTCPNLCIMTFGGTNQFRLLVFFPRNRERLENLWRNMVREDEMQDWYEAFLTALRMFSAQAPFAWQHAVEKTIEALPNTWEMARQQRNTGGIQTMSHRIEPVILNAVFKLMRGIVNTTPKLAKYRGYFFHLCGINLKLATMNIHGRMGDNPLEYGFSIFDFIDWYAQNPNDIVADVGWTGNINRRLMPEDLQNTTLLFRTDPLAELMQAAYVKPQIDQYCSSYVVGGARSTPLAPVRKKSGVVKIQAYPKDMVLTYRHQDQSVGWNWTVKQALRIDRNKEKFSNQMTGILNILRDADSYGVRLEIRASAWGANRMMKTEARDILDRLLAAQTIVCYPTATIAAFKSNLFRGWSAIINKQSQLPLLTRKSPEVVLLASVIAYWLKSLIKRPDEMGRSTQMAKRLQLSQNAREYGIPCLQSTSLDEDGLRMSYLVEAERFSILTLSGLDVEEPLPAPNTIQVIRAPDRLQSPPPSPPRALLANEAWPQSSQDFLDTLLNVHLPRTLWSHFARDRLQSSSQALRLRKKPLKRSHWQQVVEPLNTLKELEKKFSDSIDRLFPANWSITQPKRDFVAYDRDFLYRIREHVSTKPAGAQSAYSSDLRRRIRTMLTNTWDYLPNVHNHRIWAYDSGPKGQRIYRICPKAS